MQAAQPQDPYRAMLRGGAVPALAAAVVAVVVAGLQVGGRGVAGSALASVVVVASFASSLLVMSRTAKVAPQLVMLVALTTYTGKVVVLGIVMVLFAGAGWLSGSAFALTAVAVAVVWLAGELRAFTRVRTLVFVDAPATDTLTRT